MIRFLVLAALLWAGCSTAAEPLPAENFIYPGLPRGGLNNDYIWRVLRIALDHSRAAYGPYRLEAALSPPDRRQVRALSRGEPPLTVGAFTASASLARELVPVRIPLERGLLGYRVLLVRRANLAAFEQVTALEGLKAFSFGLMPSWDDGPVMRAAGLSVVPGESHDGLFRMLAAGRFDAFSRGVTEILPEYDLARRAAPGVAMEPHLLLHYPLPVYFWFSPDEAGRHRAARVEAGLRAMLADGSLRKLFDDEYGGLQARLDLAHRRIIELPNPLLDGQDPLDDEAFWLHPHQ